MRPETYQAWYEEAPPGFTFAVKGGRYITHLKRLKDVAAPLANFFASGLLRLREEARSYFVAASTATRVRRGPSCAPSSRLLPRSTKQAARLARRHDRRLAGRSETRALTDRPIRHALEIRHPNFIQPAFIALSQESTGDCGLRCRHSRPFPRIEDVMADFVYVRIARLQRALHQRICTPRAPANGHPGSRSWLAGGSAPRAALIAGSPASFRS